jgi:hypothetical protein
MRAANAGLVSLDLRAEVLEVTKGLEEYGRQVDFALAKGLNATVKQAQLAGQASIDKHFTVAEGRDRFLKNMIKVPQGGWATKNNLQVTLSVLGPNANEKRGAVLRRHEDGGTETRSGGELDAFFIPAHAFRPSDTSLPPRALYPSALGLRPRMDVSGGSVAPGLRTSKKGKLVGSASKGRKFTNELTGTKEGRTFILLRFDNPAGRTPGIYEVIKKGGGFLEGGKGGPRATHLHSELRLMWLFKKRITLPKRFDFEGTVQEVFDKQFADNFRREFAAAIATAF